MPVVKVGISASLTGQFRTQGRQARAGLCAWAQDVNGAGGLAIGTGRYSVEVICHDDGSLAGGAAEAVRRLAEEDRVVLLFGPYSSGLIRAAAPVAFRCGQVLWNQGGAAESIYRPGSRVVGILSGASEYLSALPALLLESHPSASAFAILRCSAGSFSRQVSEGLERQALANGFTKVLHREFPPEQADFSELAEEAIAARPDLLLVVGRIRHDIALARSLVSRRRGRPGPRLAAVVAAPIERFRSQLGDAVEGFVGPSQWEPPGDGRVPPAPCPLVGPTAAQVMASLRRASAANGGLPVDYPIAQAYAAGIVAERCVAQAGFAGPPSPLGNGRPPGLPHLLRQV